MPIEPMREKHTRAYIEFCLKFPIYQNGMKHNGKRICIYDCLKDL